MAFIWKRILTYISVLICLQLLLTTVEAEGEALQQQNQQQHSSRYLSHNHNNHNHHHPHPHTHHQHHNNHNHRRQKSILRHFDEISSLAGRSLRPQNATTRLRPLNTRDYYNRVLHRRLNHHHQQRHSQPSEWDYNVYNVHTNTFGSAPSATRPSNGDDNTQDVEFISVNGGSTTTKWPGFNFNRRSFGGSVTSTTTTTAPPALVPARRGYASAATSTQAPINSDVTTEDGYTSNEDGFETNTISSRKHPTYKATDMERRHICVQQRVITMPVKTTEIYTRPIMKHVNTPCQPPTQPNQICTRVQLVHEQAVRDVIRHKSAQSVTYDCCTGWTRENSLAEGCMKPICAARCQNGGNCIRPDTCSCPAGFTGRYCEQDINECLEDKPCDQTCINTLGSYQCRCREGFTLQADKQSCRKIALREEDAFEARDLENEVDIVPNEDVATRLHKIERSLANERVQTHELQRSLQATYNVVDTLKSRLSTLEKHQLDLNRLQSNFYATESRTNKLEGMLNLLLKCRNGPNANCP